jgi:hypothetical protein
MRFRLAPTLVLSPHAPRPTVGQSAEPAVEESFTVGGEYRDGPGPRGLCSRRHEVVPTRWLYRDATVRASIRNGPVELHRRIPDGAHPFGCGGTQPTESCGHGFQLAFAGRWG